MVDLEKIRIFYHVAMEGSLLSAKKILRLSSPAISKHISDLENNLNVKLFTRKKKGMQLTDEGNKLFVVAKHAVADLEKITQEMQGQQVEQDVIRIVTTPGTLGYWLIQKLTPFMEKYPHLKFRIYTIDGEVNFSESKADVGFLIKVSDPEHVSLKKITTLNLFYHASPAYIKRKGIPQNVNDLKNHDIISFYHAHHGSVGNVDWHLKVGGKDLMPYMTINSALIQFAAAVEGYGLFACSDHLNLLEKFNFVPVLKDEIKLEIDAYMVYPAAKLLDGFLKEMYDYICNSK